MSNAVDFWSAVVFSPYNWSKKNAMRASGPVLLIQFWSSEQYWTWSSPRHGDHGDWGKGVWSEWRWIFGSIRIQARHSRRGFGGSSRYTHTPPKMNGWNMKIIRTNPPHNIKFPGCTWKKLRRWNWDAFSALLNAEDILTQIGWQRLLGGSSQLVSG